MGDGPRAQGTALSATPFPPSDVGWGLLSAPNSDAKYTIALARSLAASARIRLPGTWPCWPPASDLVARTTVESRGTSRRTSPPRWIRPPGPLRVDTGTPEVGS